MSIGGKIISICPTDDGQLLIAISDRHDVDWRLLQPIIHPDLISIGDWFWWQSRKAYWTPATGDGCSDIFVGNCVPADPPAPGDGDARD